MNITPEPPAFSLLATEFVRSGAETSRLFFGMRTLLADAETGDGHPVLTVPGYGGDDGSMATLRYVLRRLGYRAYALRLGRNYEGRANRIQSMEDAADFRAEMTEGVVDRVREIHRRRGEKVSLVGWSMGGLYAFDAANRVPELTRMVVTLGSPYGDPRGTSLFGLLRWLNGGSRPVEEQDFGRWTDGGEVRGHDVPDRVLYSERDGVVSSEIAKPWGSDSLECIEVDSSHIGFAMNPLAIREVVRQLAQSAA